MNQTEFKIAVSVIILPLAIACFYFGLKDPTIKEIVEMANDKCENIPNSNSARAYCIVNYVDSYCNDNWKNSFCHEYQMRNLRNTGKLCP